VKRGKGLAQSKTCQGLHQSSRSFYHTLFLEVTDKAISQNVRLLGRVHKKFKICELLCVAPDLLVAPTKIIWKGKKGTTLFVTMQH
jgi:hypothetical protein